MTEKMFSTRFKLRYDTAANWANVESTFIPLAGEVCIYEVKAALVDKKGIVVEPPITLMKVGDGTTTLGALNYTYAKAADVYAWAKENQIVTQKDGTGNVISSLEWDQTLNGGKGGLKYTTASVATSEGMEQVQKDLDVVEKDIADNRAVWAKDTTYTFAKSDKGITITPNEGNATTITFEYLTQDEVEALIPTKTVKGKEAIKVSTANKEAEVSLAIDPGAGNVVLSQTDAGLKAEVDLSAYAKTADVPAIKVNDAGHADTADKVNHALTIGGKTFDGSETVDVTASDLGISGAMHFVGTSTSDPDTGSVTIPGKADYAPVLGDVVLYNDKEFVYSSNGWEELGDESSHALKTVKVEAGTDLVGGGTLEADRTISHAEITRTDETDTAETPVHGGKITVVSSVSTSNTGHVTGVKTKEITLPEDKNTTYAWGFGDDYYTLKFTPSEGDATVINLIASETASIHGTVEKDAIKVDVHTDTNAGITTTPSGVGLKLKENGGLKVDSEGLRISEDIIFVFDGGSATIRTGESSTGADPV